MPFRHRHKRRAAPVGWGFTFISEERDVSSEQRHDQPEHKTDPASPALEYTVEEDSASANRDAGATFPLSMVAIGERVEIVGFSGGQRFTHRLTSMGIVAGAVVRVISRTDSGSVVLAIQDSRLGLGAGMAHKVRVTLYQSP